MITVWHAGGSGRGLSLLGQGASIIVNWVEFLGDGGVGLARVLRQQLLQLVLVVFDAVVCVLHCVFCSESKHKMTVRLTCLMFEFIVNPALTTGNSSYLQARLLPVPGQLNFLTRLLSS